VILEEGIVTETGGIPTTTSSPHFESVIVTFVPPETIVVSVTGKLVAPVKRVRVSEAAGDDDVAGIVHFST
jgi:hypothetical protein